MFDIIIIIQYYNNYYNSILEYLLNYGSLYIYTYYILLSATEKF